MPDKDLIIIKWKGTTEESALLPELVTIEYAGQQIFLENGKIRVETIEPARRPNMPAVMLIIEAIRDAES